MNKIYEDSGVSSSRLPDSVEMDIENYGVSLNHFLQIDLKEEQIECESNSLSNTDNDKPYKCDQCGKTFAKCGYLTKHMRIHTGERPYKCTQCEKSFAQNRTLNEHMKTHTGVKPYVCYLCEKYFAHKNSLSNHLILHTGEKSYKCFQCNKVFALNTALQRHMKSVHIGVKPYRCDQCEQSFANNWSLKEHKKRHTGEKPHKCSHCDKTFAQSSSLTAHERIHTGEKPYKCNLCKKSFAHNSNLRRHMNHHHSDQDTYVIPHKRKNAVNTYDLEYPELFKENQTHGGEPNSDIDPKNTDEGVITVQVTPEINPGEIMPGSQVSIEENGYGNHTQEEPNHTQEEPYKCNLVRPKTEDSITVSTSDKVSSSDDYETSVNTEENIEDKAMSPSELLALAMDRFYSE